LSDAKVRKKLKAPNEFKKISKKNRFRFLNFLLPLQLNEMIYGI